MVGKIAGNIQVMDKKMTLEDQIAELEAQIARLKTAAVVQRMATSATTETVAQENRDNITQLRADSKIREHRNVVTETMQAKLVLVKAKLRGSLVSMVMCMNVLAGVAVPVLDWAQVNFPFLREFLPVQLYTSSFILIIIMNLGLRFFRTNGPLEDKI